MDGDAYSEMKRTESDHERDPDNLLYWPINKLIDEIEQHRAENWPDSYAIAENTIHSLKVKVERLTEANTDLLAAAVKAVSLMERDGYGYNEVDLRDAIAKAQPEPDLMATSQSERNELLHRELRDAGR